MAVVLILHEHREGAQEGGREMRVVGRERACEVHVEEGGKARKSLFLFTYYEVRQRGGQGGEAEEETCAEVQRVEGGRKRGEFVAEVDT